MAVKVNKIRIVGCGPGSSEYVTPAARKAVEGAEVLVGARRLLDLFPSCGGERIAAGKDVEALLQEIDCRRETCNIAILVTGDPGLYSLASSVIKRFGREACEVLPGVSALQTAFARLGLDWQDARVVSTHGTEPDLCAKELCEWAKIAILGGDRELAPRLSPLLKSFLGRGYRIFVAEDLTLPEERFHEMDIESLEGLRLSTRAILLIVKRNLL